MLREVLLVLLIRELLILKLRRLLLLLLPIIPRRLCTWLLLREACVLLGKLSILLPILSTWLLLIHVLVCPLVRLRLLLLLRILIPSAGLLSSIASPGIVLLLRIWVLARILTSVRLISPLRIWLLVLV